MLCTQFCQARIEMEVTPNGNGSCAPVAASQSNMDRSQEEGEEPKDSYAVSMWPSCRGTGSGYSVDIDASPVSWLSIALGNDLRAAKVVNHRMKRLARATLVYCDALWNRFVPRSGVRCQDPDRRSPIARGVLRPVAGVQGCVGIDHPAQQLQESPSHGCHSSTSPPISAEKRNQPA